MRTALLFSLSVLWAQDSVRARAQLRGDFVEVVFEWKGRSGRVPLGANFVLTGQPASSIAWQAAEVSKSGRWSASSTSLYRPLYITARLDAPELFRSSLNLLATHPSAGEPFSGEWELIGAWRAPLLRFGDTLHLVWSMETGEIVLSPFECVKSQFSYVAPAPLYLCPTFPNLRLAWGESELRVDGLSEFRPENLSIRWYRNGNLVYEGVAFSPVVEGEYHAEVVHVCGSQAVTDTIVWRATSASVLAKSGWRVYPNPTAGALWIEAPRSLHAEIRLQDAAGRCVLSQESFLTEGTAYRLLLPPLPTGLYHLIIYTQDHYLSLPITYAP